MISLFIKLSSLCCLLENMAIPLPIFDPRKTCQFVSAYLRVLVTVCDQDLRSALDIHIYLFSVYIFIVVCLFII